MMKTSSKMNDRQRMISPSILSADFYNLENGIKSVEEQADLLHIDVMDGHFVPNITIGVPVVEAIKKRTSIRLDVHLMIEKPDDYLEQFINAGSDFLTVHYETCPHLNRTIATIKDLGAKAFVALNPHTPVELLRDILYLLDGVLVMSVNPGFGGQQFIHNTFERIGRLSQMRDDRGLNFLIAVDGGVNETNIAGLSQSGADIFVAGSAIFKSDDPEETIKAFRSLER